ncbi:unnamed protein product [Lymnaea stagnalis]|uniref:Uncharacterized protein n=1 Tax=Lymnaea stagnalis TaxID=6523 RepID=A0AAV2HMQ3_LYMST
MAIISVYYVDLTNCDKHINISSCEAAEEHNNYTAVFRTLYSNDVFKVSYINTIQICKNMTCNNINNDIFNTAVNSSHIVLIYNVTRADDYKGVTITNFNYAFQVSQAMCKLRTFGTIVFF